MHRAASTMSPLLRYSRKHKSSELLNASTVLGSPSPPPEGITLGSISSDRPSHSAIQRRLFTGALPAPAPPSPGPLGSRSSGAFTSPATCWWNAESGMGAPFFDMVRHALQWWVTSFQG